MSPKISSRSHAVSIGAVTYCTRKPCKYGHISDRYTKTGQCKVCISAYSKTWSANNKEKAKESTRKWLASQPKKPKPSQKPREDRSITLRRYRLKKAGFPNANLSVECLPWPDEKTRWSVYSTVRRIEIAAKQKEYRDNRTEFMKERWRKYYEANRPSLIERAGMRRQALIQASPVWLTDEHRKEISEIYVTAEQASATTGISHHVDHIVPLKGRKVSGLHVPWNLQVLTAKENITKSNRFS